MSVYDMPPQPEPCGDWRVDWQPQGGGRTETHYAESERIAELLATDLVRLHRGQAVAWRWRG